MSNEIEKLQKEVADLKRWIGIVHKHARIGRKSESTSIKNGMFDIILEFNPADNNLQLFMEADE